MVVSDMEAKTINQISCRECDSCGLLHQEVDVTPEEYYNFYSVKYHKEYQKEIGQINYYDRYEHDRTVAKLRFGKYKHFLRGKRLLDIGSSNGAFVDEARKVGWDAWGVEPNKDICNDETAYAGTLSEQKFPDGDFDNITMHDVMEHLIDPVAELKEIYRVLSADGLLILDMPNFFVECGKHHWRPVEHLWMFSESQLCTLLVREGFQVLGSDVPIPSKYVIYLRKS
jgi:SAM-dependent methyltransferase